MIHPTFSTTKFLQQKLLCLFYVEISIIQVRYCKNHIFLIICIYNPKGGIYLKQSLTLTLSDKGRLLDICKAMSSQIRLDILEYLAQKPAIITDISTTFEIPLSSAALYVRNLEAAGLISTQIIPGSKGSQKLCGILVDDVKIDLYSKKALTRSDFVYQEAMPVGCYFDYAVKPSCGMASAEQDLGLEDITSLFCSPNRFKAQIIWLSEGFLEYRFNNSFLKKNDVKRIRFSFEICSEALGYNNDWPSDITVCINDRDIGIVHTEADYGGRPGKLNPSWWNSSSTQYGLLRTVEITSDGSFIDEQRVSDETITSLGIPLGDSIRFKLEVKPDAEFCGGFNLFGEKFGDYPQDILMEFYLD